MEAAMSRNGLTPSWRHGSDGGVGLPARRYAARSDGRCRSSSGRLPGAPGRPRQDQRLQRICERCQDQARVGSVDDRCLRAFEEASGRDAASFISRQQDDDLPRAGTKISDPNQHTVYLHDRF